MPIATTPLGDPFESSTQALTSRLWLDDPIPSTSPAPIVGKAQKVKGPRLGPSGATRSPKCHQPGLVRVEHQSILTQTLGEHSQYLLRILLELNAHDRVVRKPQDERTTSQSRFYLLGAPLVENVVERDIAEQR